MDDLIYNQRNIPKDQWRYGFRASAATGCGWIATYNAMRLMGYTVDIDELITWYEKQLPLIHGNAGTTMWTPVIRFRKWGFPTEVVLDRRKFDEAAKNADVCLLFYRWRKNLKLGAHFVALRHTETGFIGYNTFKNSTGPDPYGPSLEEFLKQRKYFGAILICVKDLRRSK
ncbi:MAG: hypothetical protein IJX69_00455 [Oscillospiraceae bacterium]|nr:hypothetical protein [Oscillospiraceae bacterium]